MSRKPFKLGYSIRSMGYHIAAWRLPVGQACAPMTFDAYLEVVREAEAAKLDMVFLADTLSQKAPDDPAGSAAYSSWNAEPEPISLLSALAPMTKHVGLAATASTTYNEPFHVARKFSTLDHLSGGRAAWNMVTSWADRDARNFNREAARDYSERYERGSEFLDVVCGLWDTWEDGALLSDRESGRYYDYTKVHTLNHKGKHFNVEGPLTSPRTAQGRPIIIQAGASEQGRDIAARMADVVYTNAATLEEAQEYYNDMKRRVVAYGRRPDELLIMSGISPYMGATDADGQAEYEELQRLTDPIVAGSAVFRKIPSLLGLPLDHLLREEDFSVMFFRSSAERMRDHALENKLTLGEMLKIFGTGTIENVVIGSAIKVADHMQHWYEAGACDGFNIAPPHALTCVRNVRRYLVPELQKRGLFRLEYEGTTLRENLGLPWPANRFAKGASEAETSAAGA